MTIRQLEYTSCDDGLEGIAGFQVRASSPGVPKALRDLGLRDSVYEPSPELPSMPSAQELERFPVALGYTAQPPGLVLYRSRYVGRDHTGRWGNYFAHVLTLDDANELGLLLPIDLWQSPVWSPASTRVGELPVLAGLPAEPSPAVSVTATTAFLARPGRRELLGELLAAVRAVGDGTHGRLVLVAEDSTSAALWVSAVTRSLPRSQALALSFTTFTARPESHRALLAFTTPGVSVPTYGDYRVLDLTGAARSGGSTPGDYDAVVAGLWGQEDPGRLIAAVEEVSPALQPAELDRFARLAVLVDSYPETLAWDEATVLDALEFAAVRVPGALFTAWDRVAEVVRELGGPRDLPRWSAVLSSATERGAPVPGPLLRSYQKAAVDALVAGPDQAGLWLPELDDAGLADLSSHLAPTLRAGADSGSVLPWLARPERRPVLDEVLRQLDAELGGTPDLEEAVHRIALPTARAVKQLAPRQYPWLGLVSDVALVQAGEAEPVSVLTEADRRLLPTALQWQQLVSQLWPREPPSPQEAARLLGRLSREELRLAGLPDQFVERLIDDAGKGPLDREHVQLAITLAKSASCADLGSGGLATLDAVQLHTFFDGRTASDETTMDRAIRAIELGIEVDAHVATQLYQAVSGWLLATEGWEVQGVGLPRLAKRDSRFAEVYRTCALEYLTRSSPEDTARVIVAWYQSYPRKSTKGEPATLGQRLIVGVLPQALERRGRRHLDRIEENLRLQAAVSIYGEELKTPPRGWEAWWQHWRASYERQGLFSRLRSSRSGREGS